MQPNAVIARYLNPWKFKRQELQRRVAELRNRDGDNCSRCRRPMRFDLPRGHDTGPKIEQIVSALPGQSEGLENLCLCHGRCNSQPSDYTGEVQERIRRKNEAALLSNSRSRSASAGRKSVSAAGD